MERLFDILFSSIALLLLLPLLLPIVIILKITGEGEVFYLQERIGKNGKKFLLVKFATMLKNSPNIGTGTITIKNDPRVLPLGKFLRKTKINELPQLLNIIIGDMSVIGPRPLTPEAFAAYSNSTQNIIKCVRPGLSGIGSIIFRDEEKILLDSADSVDLHSNVIAPYKGALEEWFVSNRSLRIYFMAILVTIWAILFPRTQFAWKVFKDLPEPPSDMKCVLNFYQ